MPLAFAANLTVLGLGLAAPSPDFVAEIRDVASATNPTYASWNIDSSCNRAFHNYDFRNPSLRAAALALAPSTLRFGGSGNDYLHYSLDDPSLCTPPPREECSFFTYGCLNSSHWEALRGLASAARADLLIGLSFDLAAACRNRTGGAPYRWSGGPGAANAERLFRYMSERGQRVWGFELGNEVNNVAGMCGLAPEQQADALRALRGLSARYPKVAGGAEVRAVGPDTGFKDAMPWIAGYLRSLRGTADGATRGNAMVDAVTHHVYPGITRHNWDSPEAFDRTQHEIEEQLAAVREYGIRGDGSVAQTWAGEMGPIGGGDTGTCGHDGACGTFAASLWYADDMARRARAGFSQYQRQDMIGGRYGLTYAPGGTGWGGGARLSESDPLGLAPSYYVAFLWKRLVGTRARYVSVRAASGTAASDDAGSGAAVRVYAHSGRPPSPYAATEAVAPGAITVLALNLAATAKTVALVAGGRGGEAGLPARALMWSMTAGAGGDPFANVTCLNGQALRGSVHVRTGALPPWLQDVPVRGVPIGDRQGANSATGAPMAITLPPQSLSFVVLYD